MYALCYADGFANAYGEGVETPWKELNQVGPVTREMTAGGRHDWLTWVYNYWNWLKFLDSRESLRIVYLMYTG